MYGVLNCDIEQLELPWKHDELTNSLGEGTGLELLSVTFANAICSIIPERDIGCLTWCV